MQELIAAATSQGSMEQAQQLCRISHIGASPASLRESWPVLCSSRRFSCMEACDASSTSGSSFTCSCTNRNLKSKGHLYMIPRGDRQNKNAMRSLLNLQQQVQ